MGRKRLLAILTALVVLALSVVACDDASYSGQVARVTPTPRPPSARELAAVETAQAEGTREALQEAAKSTADALALQEQATKQALNLKGTQDAQEANATRQAWEFAQTQEAVSIQATATAAAANVQATSTAEARQATATRAAIDATATAGHDQATTTAAQVIAGVQQTQAAATAQAVSRANDRERATQPLRAWWLWALLVLAIPALIYLGWRAAKTIEDRARVVRRKADEGEPFVLLEQTDKDGNRRIALPLRSFNALMDTGDVPALPSPEHQDATTMRQQVSNAIQARQAGQIAEAKSGKPKIIQQHIALPPSRTQASRKRRQIPGIVKVVGVNSLEDATREGILPPQLADAIDGEWHEVDGED